MFSLNDLPVPIEEYFTYHPPVTEARKNLHNLINETALKLALAVRDESESDFKEHQEELLNIPVNDEITKTWAKQEIEIASNLFLDSDAEENFELAKWNAIRSIQLARMFLNQAATIDELVANK